MMTMCCFQLVEQCEDEELMDIILPRLTKVMSLWELLLAKVQREWGHQGGPTRTPETRSKEFTIGPGVFYFFFSLLYY